MSERRNRHQKSTEKLFMLCRRRPTVDIDLLKVWEKQSVKTKLTGFMTQRSNFKPMDEFSVTISERSTLSIQTEPNTERRMCRYASNQKLMSFFLFSLLKYFTFVSVCHDVGLAHHVHIHSFIRSVSVTSSKCAVNARLQSSNDCT